MWKNGHCVPKEYVIAYLYKVIQKLEEKKEWKKRTAYK